ncbi:CNP1-like family protein [Laribacter hongkongensis]|uniref:CNP1-like family protein n=1 Tax=Laribacter hongkongensis TaxID=168471 RepID=UPI001EFE8942|nr:CNP1-like family protein [Laribacter hongkongensis]MCG9124855.1 CNP1-like family protein [Laribacter hongkongensis]
MSFPRLICLALACAVSSVALARPDGPRNFQGDWEEKAPWQESAAELPTWPAADDWKPFDAGRVSDNRFYVSASSITLPGDGTVRYALKVVSPEGAQNYMVEGVRCATREWKRFATGRPETASWRVNPRAGWQKMIPGHVPQVQLDRAIFCPERGYPVDSADEARKLLSRAG